MKEMYKEWPTVIKEFEVYDVNSNCMKTFPLGTKLEWQRIEDSDNNDYILINSDNHEYTIKCGNFKIEKYLVRNNKLAEQMNNLAKLTAEEVKRCEDSFEITEPTELQKEQARKIMGRKTQTEIILDYLNNIDLNVVTPQVEQWIEQQKTKYSSRLDDIQFCNASDKDIIIAALTEYHSYFYRSNQVDRASKVLRVKENYLSSFEESKAVK